MSSRRPRWMLLALALWLLWPGAKPSTAVNHAGEAPATGSASSAKMRQAEAPVGIASAIAVQTNQSSASGEQPAVTSSHESSSPQSSSQPQSNSSDQIPTLEDPALLPEALPAAVPVNEYQANWAPPIARVKAAPKTWRVVEPEASRSTMTIRESQVPVGFTLDPTDYRDGTLQFRLGKSCSSMVSLHGPAANQCLIDGAPAIEGKAYRVHDFLEITAPQSVGVHLRPLNDDAQDPQLPTDVG